MKSPFHSHLTVVLALAALLSVSSAEAAQLINQNFESFSLNSTALPAGWTKFDPDNSGTYQVVAGHNGTGGGAGRGGRWTSGTTSTPNSILGGFIQTPASASGSQPFSINFDFTMPDNGGGDDACVVFGDLSDPYGQDGSASNSFFMVVFNESATSNEVYLVTEGARTQVGLDFRSGSGLTDDTWYKVALTWTPTNGLTGTLAFTIRRASNNTLEANYAQTVTMSPNVTFGFGNFNDVGVFDNIVIDGSVIAPTVTAANDAVQVGVGGGIGFDPTLNDTTNTGTIDRSTLTIITPPGRGTATIDPANGNVIYHQTIGTTPGADSFQYRVANSTGVTGTATVNVTISGAMRLANVTSEMPATPPAGGALQLVDAMPGLTFKTAVGMTPVPGAPKQMIVVSIDGSMWMVPDTTVANPIKKEILNILSLCPSPLTRGRAFYSVVCHPNFAGDPGSPGAGMVIVTYQGKADGWQVSPPFPNTGAANNLLGDNTTSCTLRVSSFIFTPAQLEILLNSTNGTLVTNTKAAVLATEVRYINLAEEAVYHSINDCHFGPDGYLYVSFGDEGEQGEPYLNAQYITKDQFSSIVRLDIDKKPGNLAPNPHYAIPTNGSGEANFSVPADNPYVGWPMSYNGAAIPLADRYKIRTEIYATGFRNPFKFAIDPPTGDLWVGDVGMDLWEEVSRIQKGDNAGWSFWEGNNERTNIAHRIPVANPKFPEVEYLHGSDGNSVTGGLLYRGTKYPTTGLQGKYIFGDFGSGKIWTLQPGTSTKVPLSAGGLSNIVDFEVDAETGHILLMQHNSNGKIMRLRETPPISDPFPQMLSQTGAFADLATLTPNPGVVPYEPNLKFWSDHADKSRFFLIKNLTDQVTYSASDDWTFPAGMVFVKHFDMDLNRDLPGTNVKRLETRFIVRNAGGVYGVSYKWNDEGTNATLVPPEGNDFDLAITAGGGTTTQRWHIPTRAECITCHNAAANHVLSPTTQQLNRIGQLGTSTGNMLTLLSQSGYLAGMTDNPATLPRTSRPDETNVSLDERVRSYLTVNCTYCHRDQGGANQTWGTNGHETLEQMGIFYGAPVSESYHDENDRHIIPGNKTDSLIWNRIQARYAIGNGTFNGYSQMPPLASNVTDAEGIALLSQWIDTFANVAPTVNPGAPTSVPITENSAVGGNVAALPATDPDVRGGQADNNLLSYAITGGNPNGLFSIHPITGTLTINGVLDYETATQHVLQITVTDNFAPNPKATVRTLTVQVLNVANEDTNSNGIPDWWETPFALALTAAGDYEKDGLADFFEFLGGGHPGLSDASLSLRIASHVGAPNPGTYVTWRVRNGLFLNQHYFVRAAANPGGPWTVLQPANYQIISTTPSGLGFSNLLIFAPSTGTAEFFRLTNDAN